MAEQRVLSYQMKEISWIIQQLNNLRMIIKKSFKIWENQILKEVLELGNYLNHKVNLHKKC